MSIKDTRRENLRALAKSVGGITRLADKLDKTQSQISHLIGSNPIKNIGDKIAAQVEEAFNKPAGWLDHPHHSTEEEPSLYHVDQNDHNGILCRQVPLLSWEEAKHWNQIAYNYKPKNPDTMIPTTAEVGSLAFALRVYGDGMEASTGIGFFEGAIVIADPDAAATLNSFVIVRISPDRGATLKQLVSQGHKRYLKPLNRRYPILEFTPDTVILGIIKQMIFDIENPSTQQNNLGLKLGKYQKITEIA